MLLNPLFWNTYPRHRFLYRVLTIHLWIHDGQKVLPLQLQVNGRVSAGHVGGVVLHTCISIHHAVQLKQKQNWLERNDAATMQHCRLLKHSCGHPNTTKSIVQFALGRPEEGGFRKCTEPWCGGSAEASRGGQIRSSQHYVVSHVNTVTQPLHRKKNHFVSWAINY